MVAAQLNRLNGKAVQQKASGLDRLGSETALMGSMKMEGSLPTARDFQCPTGSPFQSTTWRAPPIERELTPELYLFTLLGRKLDWRESLRVSC